MTDDLKSQLLRNENGEPLAFNGKTLESLSPREQVLLKKVLLECPTASTVEEHEKVQTSGARMADHLAAFVGSWTFIVVFILTLAAWMGVNAILLFVPFDPYPFILLNLGLSCLAAIQAPIIMMSQNRQSAIDRRAAERDLKLSIKTELHSQQMLQKLDDILAHCKEHQKGDSS